MNLYSHSEEEEPDPRLTQRPPSPHGIRPPLTAAPPRPPAPRRPILPPVAARSRPRAGSAAEPGQAPGLCSRCARPGGAAAGAGRSGSLAVRGQPAARPGAARCLCGRQAPAGGQRAEQSPAGPGRAEVRQAGSAEVAQGLLSPCGAGGRR